VLESLSMIVYGTQEDGTLTPCRAKPENRGKGRCPHGQHLAFSQEDVRDGAIEKHNQNVMKEAFGGSFGGDEPIPTIDLAQGIQASPEGGLLTRPELQEGAQQIAGQITPKQWEWLQKTVNVLQTQRGSRSADVIHQQLMKDTPEMKKLRGFLNMDEEQLKELSLIICGNVTSMTRAMPWKSNRKTSVSRAILTAIDNDMTRERYLVSVLFFGGKCCYCNRHLRKGPPSDQQASGEHITPIHPKNKSGGMGSTRFGNMAMACSRCNTDRGNKDLKEWIDKAPFIKKKNKVQSLARIDSFRQLTLYSEYSDTKSQQIREQVDRLEGLVRDRLEAGSLNHDNANFIRNEIKITIYDLRHGD
jgi:5-methylcytosine-specific restriction endonuclease McrA